MHPGTNDCMSERLTNMKVAAKKALVATVPLSFRKTLAVWINRRRWLEPDRRAYWATQLLTDLADRDVNAYHKFLWHHHLAYARTYEVDLRFGYENMNETRRIMFTELPERLRDAGIRSPNDVTSVFEVGCSLGYLLRYMETDVFPQAVRLEGIDIDVHAVTAGREHLRQIGSRVSLHAGDMRDLPNRLGEAKVDVLFCLGVLLYLEQEAASALVATMLACVSGMLVIMALAHPEVDNQDLAHSVPRASDGTWIHNVDHMITAAGGRIVGRRWEGANMVDGNTIYFLYATPSESAQ